MACVVREGKPQRGAAEMRSQGGVGAPALLYENLVPDLSNA
jgi:hypothetical protein